MLHVVAAIPTHSTDNVRRFQLWDAYGVLPTVCGIKDKTGGCTYAGVQAESSANCIMPLDAVIDRLGVLKVGDRVWGGEGWR